MGPSEEQDEIINWCSRQLRMKEKHKIWCFTYERPRNFLQQTFYHRCHRSKDVLQYALVYEYLDYFSE